MYAHNRFTMLIIA